MRIPTQGRNTFIILRPFKDTTVNSDTKRGPREQWAAGWSSSLAKEIATTQARTLHITNTVVTTMPRRESVSLQASPTLRATRYTYFSLAHTDVPD